MLNMYPQLPAWHLHWVSHRSSCVITAKIKLGILTPALPPPKPGFSTVPKLHPCRCYLGLHKPETKASGWYLPLLIPRARPSPSQPVLLPKFLLNQSTFLHVLTYLTGASIVSLLNDFNSFLVSYTSTPSSLYSVLHAESSFKITNLLMLLPCLTPFDSSLPLLG